MTSQQYKYIVTVSQEGSLTRAAQKLGISSSQLNTFFQIIENELGATILKRNGPYTHLNYVGEELAGYARKILFTERKMEQEMIDRMNKRTGILSIGASAYRSTYMLPQILREFQRKYRNTQLSLFEAPAEDMESLVLEGKVDIAITDQASVNSEIDSRFLAIEEMVIAVPRCYGIEPVSRAANKRFPEIRMQQLQDIPFIFLTTGTSLYNLTIRLMEKKKFIPSSRLESKSLEAIYALVLEGVGAATIPVTMAISHLFPDLPQFFTIEDEEFHRSIYAIYRKDAYLSMACREFLNLLIQNVTQI